MDEVEVNRFGIHFWWLGASLAGFGAIQGGTEANLANTKGKLMKKERPVGEQQKKH